MTTRLGAVVAVLNGDSALMALATGGVFSSETVGERGMTRDLIAVADQVAVRPAVYVNASTTVPFGTAQRKLGAERSWIEIFFYASERTVIWQMRERVRMLLEYQPVQFDEPAGYWTADIFWQGDVLDMVDEAMGHVMFDRSRYQILSKRVPNG